MNQQTLMATLSAYPAPKASDELLWQILDSAWRNEEPVHHRDAKEAEAVSAQALMSRKIEKMLSITRHSWATR